MTNRFSAQRRGDRQSGADGLCRPVRPTFLEFDQRRHTDRVRQGPQFHEGRHAAAFGHVVGFPVRLATAPALFRHADGGAIGLDERADVRRHRARGPCRQETADRAMLRAAVLEDGECGCGLDHPRAVVGCRHRREPESAPRRGCPSASRGARPLGQLGVPPTGPGRRARAGRPASGREPRASDASNGLRRAGAAASSVIEVLLLGRNRRARFRRNRYRIEPASAAAAARRARAAACSGDRPACCAVSSTKRASATARADAGAAGDPVGPDI